MKLSKLIISCSLIIIALTQLCSNVVYAQTWIKTFGLPGKQSCINIIETYDNGFLVCGYNLKTSSVTILLIKTDINGDTLWSKEIGNTSSSTYPAKIAKTSDGCFLIAATTSKYYQSTNKRQNAFLLKVDACGEQVWCKLLGDASHDATGCDVMEYYDGSYLILANYVETEHVTVFRVSSNGDLISRNNYDNTTSPYYFNSTYASSFLQTNDYGYMITGGAYIPNPIDTTITCIHPVLIKVDSTGTQEWVTDLGQNPNIGMLNSVEVSDNNFVSFGTIGDSVYIYRTDSSGNNYLLQAIYSPSYYNYGGVQKLNDSTFLFLINKYNNALSQFDSIKFVIMNLNGTVISQNAVSYSGGIYATSIERTFDNQFIIGGLKKNSSNDMIAIKIDDSLNFSSLNINIYTYDTLCSHNIVSSFYDIDTSMNINTGMQNLGIKEVNDVYPNPFTNEISITIEKPNVHNATFSIHNILGEELFTTQEDNLNSTFTQKIDLSFLSKGIYLLDVIIDGEITVKKIVKE